MQLDLERVPKPIRHRLWPHALYLPNPGFVTKSAPELALECGVHPDWRMNPNLAFLNPRHSEGCSSFGRQTHEAFPPGDSAVRMEFSIRADTRRLFQVLTVPEYVEAWLRLPGHDGCSPAATRIHDDYLLEHSCSDGPAVLITGTYLVCRRRNVMFSWRVDGDLCVPESAVEIRLQGNFERTTLSLEHTGFDSGTALLWHKALWNASMARLLRLYDASDSLDSARL